MMKKINKISIILILSLFSTHPALAGDVTVTLRSAVIENGQEGSVVIAVIPIAPVAGIQFELAFDPDQVSVRAPEFVSEPKGFQIYSRIKNVVVKSLIFNLNGTAFQAEDEVLIRVPITPVNDFTGIVDYVLNNLILAGSEGQILEIDYQLGIIEATGKLPLTFKVDSNYPNPFNAKTLINYELPDDALVLARIYSITGQLVRVLKNASKPAGYHQLVWEGTDGDHKPVSSGEYILVIKAGEQQFKQKMLYLK
jgi:hypothetical protein